MDMYNYSCGGVTGARRFGRCLPCAIGKPGKCGAASAAWFCRRRLAVLDTRDMPPGDKTAALLMDGERPHGWVHETCSASPAGFDPPGGVLAFALHPDATGRAASLLLIHHMTSRWC